MSAAAAICEDEYRAFLAGKAPRADQLGFPVGEEAVNPELLPHVRAIVPWACRGGRRAIFAAFGLAKTSMQIEIVRQCLLHAGGHGLIVCPLGVRHEFMLEQAARHSGVTLKFVRRVEEMLPGNAADQAEPVAIHLTNYETVRDGKLDPSRFTVVSLDEAAVLRGFGGTKTFRELMATMAGDDRRAGEAVRREAVRYRFVATAVPDPNDYIELLAYAAFLGVMDVGEAKTRFFRRDSEKADKLTLHPHKQEEFWHWVASWALFMQRPSDLGFSDEGYDLPPLDVRWHEVPSDHRAAGAERDGQGRLFVNAAFGVTDAAREKRDSLAARIARMQAIRSEDPVAHRLIWHDLEAERKAIEAAVPGVVSIYGTQDLDERERRVVGFARGEFAELAAKPVLAGSGCNFQAHCAHAIYLGIGFKFHDFIQSIYRIQRFGQTRPVRIDLIYTEAEREIRRQLEAKWRAFEAQAARMAAIIRRFGLAAEAIGGLKRSLGVARREVVGETFRLINNDCVIEAKSLADGAVDLIVTSIPFSTQYEYTPSYHDFGHTDDDAHFWAQMDFLTPELLRVLAPGRVAAVHVKDRIVPGGINGFGFSTVSPFSDDCIAHFRRHGFAFLARKTIVTDVVRENNQTYRLGWSEQCKDGSRMGCGMPEYLLLFRKPPSDRSDGYADVPVVKQKPQSFVEGCEGEHGPFDRRRRPVPGTGYSRGRWQLDAHGFTRSDGDRPLLPQELAGLPADQVYKRWREFSLSHVADHEHHVVCAETLDARGELPPTFMLLPPHSWHPDVWTDVARMRTLNSTQAAKGREMHLCPLPFDIVERAIRQFSMEGETVLDPFMGIGTVPFMAVKMKRCGVGIELSPDYFRDAVLYVEAAEKQASVPTLFQLIGAESSAA